MHVLAAVAAAATDIGDYLADPERLTLMGVLALLAVAFQREWIVPGSRVVRAERQRDRLFDLTLRLAGVADKSVSAQKEVIDLMRAPDAGPMEGNGIE